MSGPDPYRELFERSADAILIIEGEMFVDCNQATVEMLRHKTKQDVLDTHPSELSPPTQPDGRQSYEKANEMISIAFEKGSHRFEWNHRRADGEVFPVEVLLTAVEERGKRILHVVWRDITERKALERQLHQAQKLEAVGQLAGGIAHDFNNLLVVILGHAELLEMRLRDQPSSLEHVREIRESGQRAARLVRQLLAFSRKQEFNIEVVDLNKLLAGVDGLLRRLIGEDVRLYCHGADFPLRVKADTPQLEQILLNLATNARDAMPNGGQMTLELRRVYLLEGMIGETPDLPPGTYAVISVSDTGEGMDEQTVQRAFDPFFTTKEVGKGTGLGLASVRGIVRRFGGAVNIYSSPGGGTSVRVYLPATSDDPGVSNETPHPEAELGGDEAILVVEDEAPVAELVVTALRSRGYNVVLARDGRDALEKWGFHGGEFDLVLSDVVMPNLSGPSFINALHEAGDRPRVLFMSGYTDSALSRVKYLGAEVDLLEKPFTPTSLLARVRRVLDKSSEQGAEER